MSRAAKDVEHAAREDLLRHEKECAERYGQIEVQFAMLRIEIARNTKLLYVLIVAVGAVLTRSIWQVFGG